MNDPKAGQIDNGIALLMKTGRVQDRKTLVKSMARKVCPDHQKLKCELIELRKAKKALTEQIRRKTKKKGCCAPKDSEHYDNSESESEQLNQDQ